MPPLANAAGLLETIVPEEDAAKRWLTTRAAVKAALSIVDTSKDSLIDSLIARASALIADECSLAKDNAGGIPSFAREGLRATWFTTRGTRGAVLALPWRVPVTQIVSVMEGGVTVDPSGYRLIAAKPGRLQRLKDGAATYWPCTEIVVSFTAGFDLPGTVVPVLEAACIEQLRGMVFAADRDPAIKSESSPDVGSVSYTTPGGDTHGALTAPYLLPSVRDMLSTWQDPMP